MKIYEAKDQNVSVPFLRVYWGDGDDEASGQTSSGIAQQARQEWLSNEAFWAGRNRAERISARLVA